MQQILLHLWGDYILQNNWMAVNKVEFNIKGWLACLIHCILYSLPFLLIGSIEAIFIIFSTHFLIDKFYLAKYLCRFKNWCFNTQTGFPDYIPDYIKVWLLFINDNILHITINYLALVYF